MTHQVSTAATACAFHRALVRFAIAAGLALASSAPAAQGAVTLYGGARGGGEFIDDNAGATVIKLDSGATVSLSLDWPLADGRQAQIFYSFQRSALPGSVLNRTGDVAVNINYLHGGGRVFFAWHTCHKWRLRGRRVGDYALVAESRRTVVRGAPVDESRPRATSGCCRSRLHFAPSYAAT